MLTTITADDVRNARLNGHDALKNLLAQIPSVESASAEQIDRFILAMERPHA